MTDLSVFRVYAESECGPDQYPLAWHSIDGGPGVKHLVREAAGNRCVRCQHPYKPKAGEWSPCDERCLHGGEVRDPDATGVLSAYTTDSFTVNHRVLKGIPVEAHWRILTVHHLRLGDAAKRDLRWWNVVALCQRCHLQIQGKVVMERIWPWEHSAWFRPYAAGWYAWTYLGEEITREEATARMDELLALECA